MEKIEKIQNECKCGDKRAAVKSAKTSNAQTLHILTE